MKGALPWFDCWACSTGTRDFCPALAALVGPVHRKLFQNSIYLFPSPSKLGKQSCWVACLLVCFSGVYTDLTITTLNFSETELSF